MIIVLVKRHVNWIAKILISSRDFLLNPPSLAVTGFGRLCPVAK
jgi:hypothetical protein